MAVTTSPYASDVLPDATVDAAVIGGGAAGLNGELMLARSRRSVVVIDSGTPRNAPAEATHGFTAQVGVSVTAGALAGSHINALPATAGTDAALVAARGGATAS